MNVSELRETERQWEGGREEGGREEGGRDDDEVRCWNRLESLKQAGFVHWRMLQACQGWSSTPYSLCDSLHWLLWNPGRGSSLFRQGGGTRRPRRKPCRGRRIPRDSQGWVNRWNLQPSWWRRRNWQAVCSHVSLDRSKDEQARQQEILLTTFRVPVKGSKGDLSLVCTKAFLLLVSFTSELMCPLNVCSLGWLIESNTVRSVTSVSLSPPEPASR